MNNSEQLIILGILTLITIVIDLPKEKSEAGCIQGRCVYETPPSAGFQLMNLLSLRFECTREVIPPHLLLQHLHLTLRMGLIV